ncbi:hypothetical protein CC78DRAFT_595748 [Lojkania enalia]|uniref:Uncharacterized protein n=1 Tax=Lojkania enalia TaxID=147567 RepID=A0A9P4JXG0_9PLEO|nr:hypothetical protein CC78DRAFT_595748 [Didymosphaeria enalia]
MLLTAFTVLLPSLTYVSYGYYIIYYTSIYSWANSKNSTTSQLTHYNAYFNGTLTMRMTSSDGQCNMQDTVANYSMQIGAISPQSNTSLSRKSFDNNPYYFSLEGPESTNDSEAWLELESSRDLDSITNATDSMFWSFTATKNGGGWDTSGKHVKYVPYNSQQLDSVCEGYFSGDIQPVNNWTMSGRIEEKTVNFTFGPADWTESGLDYTRTWSFEGVWWSEGAKLEVGGDDIQTSGMWVNKTASQENKENVASGLRWWSVGSMGLLLRSRGVMMEKVPHFSITQAPTMPLFRSLKSTFLGEEPDSGFFVGDYSFPKPLFIYHDLPRLNGGWGSNRISNNEICEAYRPYRDLRSFNRNENPYGYARQQVYLRNQFLSLGERVQRQVQEDMAKWRAKHRPESVQVQEQIMTRGKFSDSIALLRNMVEPMIDIMCGIEESNTTKNGQMMVFLCKQLVSQCLVPAIIELHRIDPFFQVVPSKENLRDRLYWPLEALSMLYEFFAKLQEELPLEIQVLLECLEELVRLLGGVLTIRRSSAIFIPQHETPQQPAVPQQQIDSAPDLDMYPETRKKPILGRYIVKME